MTDMDKPVAFSYPYSSSCANAASSPRSHSTRQKNRGIAEQPPLSRSGKLIQHQQNRIVSLAHITNTSPSNLELKTSRVFVNILLLLQSFPNVLLQKDDLRLATTTFPIWKTNPKSVERDFFAGANHKHQSQHLRVKDFQSFCEYYCTVVGKAF